MSNRSLIELNHDYCPSPRDDAALLDWARAMVSYMGGADPADLPRGVERKHYRHHSEPCPLEPRPLTVPVAISASDLQRLKEQFERAASSVEIMQGQLIAARAGIEPDTFAEAGAEAMPGTDLFEALADAQHLVPTEVHGWAIVRRLWAVVVPVAGADGQSEGDEIMEFTTKEEAATFVQSAEAADAGE